MGKRRVKRGKRGKENPHSLRKRQGMWHPRVSVLTLRGDECDIVRPSLPLGRNIYWVHSMSHPPRKQLKRCNGGDARGGPMRNFAYPMLGALILAMFSSYGIAPNAAEVPVTNRGDRLTYLSVPSRTVLGITLGRSTLKEVQEKLGSAKLWSSGDAATAEQKVCYVTVSHRPVVVVFASSSEMAGPPQNRVTDIRIVGRGMYPDIANCLKLPISSNEVRTKSGLGLGISRQVVRSIIGMPTRVSKSEWSYFWSNDRPLPQSDKHYSYWASRSRECFDGKAPFFSVNSQLELRFDGNSLVALMVSRMESIC